MSLFKKFTQGLSKTKNDLSNKLNQVFRAYQVANEEMLEDLEEILISSDIGVNTTMDLVEALRRKIKEEKIKDPQTVMVLLKQLLKETLSKEVPIDEGTLLMPRIILVVGVNGVGKTTTIGKLAYRYKNMGKKVIVAAGDTFRAAAVEQLQIWCDRAGVDLVSNKEGSDPAAVIFDGIQAAKARKADILICDTAGRLHNKKNLMNELHKIFKVVDKEYDDEHKDVFLVVDATTGQNGIIQAKTFQEVVTIDGIVLTKLDGTAKGGVVIPVQNELKVPVRYVGLGEKIDDMQPFDVDHFVEAIFGQE